MQFLFEDQVLDVDRRELTRSSTPVALEPQVFDLLVFLLRHRDHVVSKDDLIAGVWGGRIVSESTLTSRINAARKAVRDSGGEQRLIRTIPRKGFRFVGSVAEHEGPAGAPTAATAEVREAQQVRFCRTNDGINLAVAEIGQGPPLVKVANWLTHVEYDWESPIWRPFLHRLAEHRRLVRYDGRGNGLSDRDTKDISFAAFEHDLATVLENLTLSRYALLGISQGASVAIAHAVRHPDRVSKLILYGAYAQGRNRRNSVGDQEMARANVALMRHGWGQENSAFMRAFSSIYLPNGTAEQIKWFADLQRITTSADTALRLREACDDIDVTALLPQVRVPTLVVHCRQDSVAPLEQGRMIAATIPHAKFVMLDSANHVVLPDEPAWTKLMNEIDAFLSE